MTLISFTGVHLTNKKGLPFLFLVFLSSSLFLISSCALRRGDEKAYVLQFSTKAKGIYHIVSDGQNLWRISKVYQVPPEKIARYNKLDDKAELKTGQKLFIPGALKVKYVPPYPLPLDAKSSTPPVSTTPPASPAPAEGADSKPVSQTAKSISLPLPENLEPKQKTDFIWPLKGLITSTFGSQGGTHFAIDIAAPKGTPIKAAADGIVSYVDYTPLNYGNVIIIQHTDNYASVYAHNTENLVKAGQKVTQGTIIGTVGSTGKATGNHLHFELRYKRKARNPLWYLPH